MIWPLVNKHRPLPINPLKMMTIEVGSVIVFRYPSPVPVKVDSAR